MKKWRVHRLWLGTLIFAGLLAAGGAPALHGLGGFVAARQAMRQFEDDIALARKIGDGAERAALEQVLAPVDRLQTASMLEQQAGYARLTHFAYTVSPERLTPVDTPGGAQNLGLSIVTVAADAPLDTDIYAYLSAVQRALPGRARLTHLAITHDGKNAGLAEINLHFEATLEWLSNGADKKMAGNP